MSTWPQSSHVVSLNRQRAAQAQGRTGVNNADRSGENQSESASFTDTPVAVEGAPGEALPNDGQRATTGSDSEDDPSSDRTHAEEHERLALETRELLQHAIQSGLSYQSYLHKFCLQLQKWGMDDVVTDGIETTHDPPCPRLEDLRKHCRPGQYLQPRLTKVSTDLMQDFLVNLRVDNRFKGAHKGKMIVPAHGTHSWYRNALSHAFKIAEVPKPDDWDTKLGQFIRALKKKQAKQKAAGTFKGRHTGGRDKMDFDVFRRAMFDFLTGDLSSTNPKNTDKERNKTSDPNPF